MLTSVRAKAMMVLLLAAALTDAQQACHDSTEYEMYYKLQAYHDQLRDIWNPPARLLRVYARAHSCYVAYLYRVRGCASQLSKLGLNLDAVISPSKVIVPSGKISSGSVATATFARPH